jgi:hypothetical protein
MNNTSKAATSFASFLICVPLGLAACSDGRESVETKEQALTEAEVADEPHEVQSAEDALATDIAPTATHRGVSVEAVEETVHFQERFTRFADEIMGRLPDQISAVWMDPLPATTGHVRFVGDVPQDVESELAERGDIDPRNVSLTGGGKIPMAEWIHLAELAADALVDAGYGNCETHYDFEGEVIRAHIQLPVGTEHPSQDDIQDLVQDSALSAANG